MLKRNSPLQVEDDGSSRNVQRNSPLRLEEDGSLLMLKRNSPLRFRRRRFRASCLGGTVHLGSRTMLPRVMMRHNNPLKVEDDGPTRNVGV